jgi:hypothetical protein
MEKNAALLIDDYVAPILKTFFNPELISEIFQAMFKLYDNLKVVDNFMGFTFITGVTTTGEASIFSAFNNLFDLTLSEKYASICGFTVEEFDDVC